MSDPDPPLAEVVLSLPLHRRGCADFLLSLPPHSAADALEACSLLRGIASEGTGSLEARHNEEVARLREIQARDLERVKADHRSELSMMEARFSAAREEWERRNVSQQKEEGFDRDEEEKMEEAVSSFYETRKRLPRSFKDVEKDWKGKSSSQEKLFAKAVEGVKREHHRIAGLKRRKQHEPPPQE